MIHPTAIIDKSVILEEEVQVGPFAYIGKNCILRKGVKIGAHAIVESNCEIGEDTTVSPNAHIAGPPQDIGYRGEDTKLKIGKRCIIREFATIHRATTKEDWVTEIGDDCYIMASAHVAHDCKIGNGVIVTSYAAIAGHVHIDDFAIISGMVAVHQFVRIGKMAMISGLSGITQDVPPFTLVEGRPAVIHGLNSVGLRRRGVSPEARNELKRLLKIYLDKSLTKDEAIQRMRGISKTKEGEEFINFLLGGKRGIIRR